MTNQEAIKTIKDNWPTSNYTMLQEALTIAIKAIKQFDDIGDLDLDQDFEQFIPEGE